MASALNHQHRYLGAEDVGRVRTGLSRRRRNHLLAAVLVSWSTLALAPTSPAQTAASEEEFTYGPLTTFVLGNLEFILLHELAHMIIRDFEIPIIGPEENAADYVAAAALLTLEGPDAAAATRAHQFLLATAEGLATSWEFSVRSGQQIRYWDSHSLTIQRFYQINCLIYGSDPDAFADLPLRVGMPAQRAAGCRAEFERAERSLQWMLSNFGRQPDDPPGANVDIVFEDPPTRVSQTLLSELQSSGLLDRTVQRLHEKFTILSPFRIALRRCGERQARWLPEPRELQLCYELIDNYYLLGSRIRTQSEAPAGPEPPG